MKLALCLLTAGCGSVVSPSHQGPSPDAGTDTSTSVARCDVAKPFGAPTLVPGVNSAVDEVGFALTSNELIAVVDRFDDTTAASWSLLATERASLASPFDAPSLRDTRDLDAEPGEELSGWPSSDGLALYFARQAAPGDTPRLFVATRNVTTSTFADVAITLDGTTAPGYAPSLSADGTTLYWVDAADARLRAATRSDGAPDVFVGQHVVSSIRLGNPVLSADELALYYTDGAQTDILVATRATKNAPFGVGVPVANVNSTDNDAPMYLSNDGCVLYLSSNRPGGIGGIDIWQAARPR